jgi:hypothetical protein
VSWADPIIKELEAGNPVSFRPKGRSMEPLIKSGQLVTVTPVGIRELKRGDIVLCHVAGNHYLHLIKGVDAAGLNFLIGNNRGRINGWTMRTKIYGVVTQVAP